MSVGGFHHYCRQSCHSDNVGNDHQLIEHVLKFPDKIVFHHGSRKNGGNRQMLEFHIPTRGLIGFRSKALTASQGEAVVNHIFDHYEPFKGAMPRRSFGVMVSMAGGKALPFAIDGLQQRGEFFIEPGTDAYEGMIVGMNSRNDDMVVNPCKAKKATNMRAAGSDDAIKLTPARIFTLEEALEFINDDELVEITPKSIRMRKRVLGTEARKKLEARKKS